MAKHTDKISIRGARVHNLQNVDVQIPRDRLTVVTGPSGAGKSSLVFDTIYAEGRRRYLETVRSDASARIEQLQRPDVDSVNGLPPVLCVSQRTAAARPRSTLATLTELHDHFRLLWSRLGTRYCYRCQIPIHRQTIGDIVEDTLQRPDRLKIFVMAPLVRRETGNHQQILKDVRQAGFLRVRIDDILVELFDVPKLEPNKKHNIDLVVDRLVIRSGIEDRLKESLQTASRYGNGSVIITDIEEGDWNDVDYSTHYACRKCGVTVRELSPRHFSFNNPEGACSTCSGMGELTDLDPKLIVPHESETLADVVSRIREYLPDEAEFPTPSRKSLAQFRKCFPHAGEKSWATYRRLHSWPPDAKDALLHGTEQTKPAFPGLLAMVRESLEGFDDVDVPFFGSVPCPDCNGARLKLESRAVRFAEKTLPDVTAMTVEDALAFFQSIDDEPFSSRIAQHLLPEITSRLHFLREVGLGYLTLDRPAQTLSGGELQRARLATRLGGGLLGVCYILDEPTIGLHPRDTRRLLDALQHLKKRGNTLIVVEHDEEVIREADHLVDIGPRAGRDGGRIVAEGTVADVTQNAHSVTGRFLANGKHKPNADAGMPESEHRELTVVGARHHNLKNVTVSFPLGRLICITGVSGSGKSSLVHEILGRVVRRHLGLLTQTPGEHDRVEGLEHIDRMVEVDQKPLGRSSRSNPATYCGFFDEIRKLFALTKSAKVRGYKANRFSFNVKGGRCEECEGQGTIRVAMKLLPDLETMCPVCYGKRFDEATLTVKYRGKSIADVLGFSAKDALDFFVNVEKIARPLRALVDMGLGYIKLGQSASDLSGGEAQRVKLASELARARSGHTLFVMDEPTTGLHFVDVDNFIRVTRGLVEASNTVIVIEHHLDVIRAADWLIDLGPEAGDRGGGLVAAGPPAKIAECAASITGRFLNHSLKD